MILLTKNMLGPVFFSYCATHSPLLHERSGKFLLSKILMLCRVKRTRSVQWLIQIPTNRRSYSNRVFQIVPISGWENTRLENIRFHRKAFVEPCAAHGTDLCAAFARNQCVKFIFWSLSIYSLYMWPITISIRSVCCTRRIYSVEMSSNCIRYSFDLLQIPVFDGFVYIGSGYVSIEWYFDGHMSN